MIEIVKSFTGYPDGKKRRFALGERPDDLSSDYQKMLIDKGLATKAPAKRAKHASE